MTCKAPSGLLPDAHGSRPASSPSAAAPGMRFKSVLKCLPWKQPQILRVTIPVSARTVHQVCVCGTLFSSRSCSQREDLSTRAGAPSRPLAVPILPPWQHVVGVHLGRAMNGCTTSLLSPERISVRCGRERRFGSVPGEQESRRVSRSGSPPSDQTDRADRGISVVIPRGYLLGWNSPPGKPSYRKFVRQELNPSSQPETFWKAAKK